MKKISEIRKITPPDIETFFKEYVDTPQPVIIQGVVNEWEASKKWNLDYFSKVVGDIAVGYKKCASSYHPDFYNIENVQIKQTTFSGYIEKLLNEAEGDRAKYFLSGDETCFYDRGNVNESLLPLYKDFSIPQYCPKDELYKVGIWVTAKGVRSWLHYDRSGAYNLNAQITGKKRVYLFEPNESKYLSMYLNSRAELFNFSEIDISSPNFDKFPLLKKASYMVGEVEAGDLLYIPGYWLHAFEHLGEININVNFWWLHNLTMLHPLSERAAFLESFWKAYDITNGGSTNKIQKFFSENVSLQATVEKIEKSFFAEK